MIVLNIFYASTFIRWEQFLFIREFWKGNITMSKNKNLAVIDGETLMDMRIKPISFCIDSLLPQKYQCSAVLEDR